MDLQQIFDASAGGVIAQNARAISKESGGCVLVNKEGMCCAVGQLIPEGEHTDQMDEGADAIMEAHDVESFVNCPLGKAVSTTIGEITSEKIELLFFLQMGHDDHGGPGTMDAVLESFKGTAEYFKLSFDAVQLIKDGL